LSAFRSTFLAELGADAINGEAGLGAIDDPFSNFPFEKAFFESSTRAAAAAATVRGDPVVDASRSVIEVLLFFLTSSSSALFFFQASILSCRCCCFSSSVRTVGVEGLVVGDLYTLANWLMVNVD